MLDLAGADAAPAIQAAADELRQKIREANDPVEAQRLIGDFRQQFNTLQARENNRKEDAEQLNTMSTSTGSEMAALNTALPPGMEYEEVDAGTVARADAAFQKNFQYVDGKIMVEGPEETSCRLMKLHLSTTPLRTDQLSARLTLETFRLVLREKAYRLV